VLDLRPVSLLGLLAVTSFVVYLRADFAHVASVIQSPPPGVLPSFAPVLALPTPVPGSDDATVARLAGQAYAIAEGCHSALASGCSGGVAAAHDDLQGIVDQLAPLSVDRCGRDALEAAQAALGALQGTQLDDFALLSAMSSLNLVQTECLFPQLS